jgi:predicted AlkP superfamily phosphohydrolase/phosphomutase
MKTLVIGLDCATWRVMTPLIEQGDLPHLQMLMKEGASGILRSTIPPMTPLAWTSIVTGVNPGKHGLYDFVCQDCNTYRVTPVNYSRLFRPAIWDIFNAYDKKIGVVNFPLAFPTPQVESFFISGIASPENQNFAHPSYLMDFLQGKNYRIYPSFAPNNGAKRYLQEIKDLTDIQIEATRHFMKEEAWELMIAVFMGIDWVQHYLWDKKIAGNNAVHDFYRYIDVKLGEILSEAEEEWNIIVLSDHGAREIEGEIHLNLLMEKWGYLNRSEIPQDITTKARNLVLNAAQNLGRKIPFSLKQHAKQLLKTRYVDKEPHRKQLKLHNMIDWRRTRAFSYGYMGHIYIHKKGKYPLGIVDTDEEYETLREEIIARLKSLQDPETGQLIVDKIFRAEEIYEGERLANASDIIFNPTGFRYMIYGDFGDSWFLRPQIRLADHDMEGILIMKGKEIQQRVKVNADVVDIAPTLLYLHDLPILDDMDGQVLQEAFDARLISKRKVLTVKSTNFTKQTEREYGDTEQQEVEKRLRDLGYL